MEASVPTENKTKGAVKSVPVCWKCKSALDYRVPRGMLVKMFLFWMPLRRYFCYGCAKKRYIRG